VINGHPTWHVARAPAQESDHGLAGGGRRVLRGEAADARLAQVQGEIPAGCREALTQHKVPTAIRFCRAGRGARKLGAPSCVTSW